MPTSAGTWIRVSTGGQDEQNQTPDVERYCKAHDYNVTRRYELNDRSAFKGEQQAKLDEMLNDVRTGQIQVLVCWHSDRLERRGVEALFKLLREVREAGGKIESVKEPTLGETDVGSVATTALSGIMSNAESAKKSAAILLSRNRVRDGGALWGRANWGYDITGPKYLKTLTPNALGLEYVPQAFQRIADGETCKQVAAWLGKTAWPGVSHKTVLRMIRNRVYMGIRMDAEGRPETRVPALVTATLWLAANERLSNGNRGKRGPAKGNPALLTSVLFCDRCGAKMYRIRPPGRGDWYRCHGVEPENRGCGNLVKLDATDKAVINLLSEASDPWTELKKIPGKNYDDELTGVGLELTDLPKLGLSRKDEQDERERLWAEQDRLTELNKHATPDKWIETATGQTVGQHFASLDYDGRRAMLLDCVKLFANRATSGHYQTVRFESRLFKSDLEPWITYSDEPMDLPAGWWHSHDWHEDEATS
jgi:DNA invertase Pin-like site-specific DNA recombinase